MFKSGKTANALDLTWELLGIEFKRMGWNHKHVIHRKEED